MFTDTTPRPSSPHALPYREPYTASRGEPRVARSIGAYALGLALLGLAFAIVAMFASPDAGARSVVDLLLSAASRLFDGRLGALAPQALRDLRAVDLATIAFGTSGLVASVVGFVRREPRRLVATAFAVSAAALLLPYLVVLVLVALALAAIGGVLAALAS